MEAAEKTRSFLLGQCARYTDLQPQDLLKALHQSVFGCGHFVTDEEGGIALARRELREAIPAPGPAVELLDGPYCRVHLAWARDRGLSPETLFRLFALSAEEETAADPEARSSLLEEKLTVLLDMAREDALPFAPEEVEHAVDAWREAGFPACHHSAGIRDRYAPAYRLIRQEYLPLLPLLADLDRRRKARRPLTVALEGGAASGKSTLAALLEQLYGCTVLHMDDFFLRPEQRTEERLAAPGGNIDHERFSAEVLEPLRLREPIRYRRYDCASQTVLPAVEIRPGRMTVVEGAYSMHPALGTYYDYAAFLDVEPDVQCTRIQARNTPELQEKFFSTWIPMENAYFAAMMPRDRCDRILEVQA